MFGYRITRYYPPESHRRPGLLQVPQTTPDDDPELPPPSAQHTPYVAACDRRNNTPASGVPRRDERMVSGTSLTVAATHAARLPAVSHSKLHSDHTRLSSMSMNPSSASQTAAKPSASSSAPVHAPPTLPSGVAASARTFFDPWNSSSTGHQRAENRPSGSTSWRQSRSLKLEQQYRGGLGGGKRVADTVGAGSADFGNDGRKANRGWEKGPKGLRTGGQQSLAKVWGKSKASMTAKRLSLEEKLTRDDALRPDTPDGADEMVLNLAEHDAKPEPEPRHLTKPPEKQIFRGLCFYITGSTMPLISDHKLKYVLTQHGASQSIALGRRTVTHVILGTTCGGGLAGSKLQKEITKTRGNTVKYISVEWVLESIKAEKRLPESRFSPVKLAAERQSSVLAFGAGGATRPAAK